MRKWTIMLAVPAIALSLGWLMAQSKGKPGVIDAGTAGIASSAIGSSLTFTKSEADAAARDFGDKILFVTYCPKEGPSGGLKFVIRNASVHKIGERWFLSGVLCGEFKGQDTYADQMLRIPFNDVVMLYEFDSLAAAKKALDLR